MWAVSKLEAGGGVVALQVSVKVDKEGIQFHPKGKRNIG